MAEPATPSALVVEPCEDGDQSLVAKVRALWAVAIDFGELGLTDQSFADGFREVPCESNVLVVLFVDSDDDRSTDSCGRRNGEQVSTCEVAMGEHT